MVSLFRIALHGQTFVPSLSLSLPCAAMFVFIESLKRDFRVHALSKIKKAKLVRVRVRVSMLFCLLSSSSSVFLNLTTSSSSLF